MNEIVEDINDILAKWDPIGVGQEMVLYEYKGYIPEILHLIQSRSKLMEYLENMLTNEMGIDYDSHNRKHYNDLQVVCDNLIQIYLNHN